MVAFIQHTPKKKNSTHTHANRIHIYSKPIQRQTVDKIEMYRDRIQMRTRKEAYQKHAQWNKLEIHVRK